MKDIDPNRHDLSDGQFLNIHRKASRMPLAQPSHQCHPRVNILSGQSVMYAILWLQAGKTRNVM